MNKWLFIVAVQCALFLVPGSFVFASNNQDSLFVALSKMNEKNRVTYINEKFYEFYSDDFDLALKLGAEALDIAEKNKWTELEALTLKNMGIVNYLKGNYDVPLKYYQQALDKYEQLGKRSGQAEVLKEMGNYFKRVNRHDKALEQLERAILLCTAVNDTNCLTASLDIKGVVLLEQGKLNEAEAMFMQEMALLERFGNDKALSYTLTNLADVAIGKGSFDQAESYLQRSTAIRKRLGDSHGVAININNTGEMLLKSGQAARALPFFEETLQKTAELGFTDLHRHAMQMLSETYTALGQHEKAMQWLQQSYALKDSLFNVERSRQVAEMAEKYETVKKEKELALQQRQLQSRNFLLSLALGGLVVLALAFGFVFRQQKLKQKQLKREAELKTELVKSELTLRLQSERLRISRDLHDNLGAELTIIGSSLLRRAASAATETEKTEMEAIGNSARQAMSQLRETIWAIRYEQFTLQDLSEKIGDFAARATQTPLNICLPEQNTQLSPAQTLNLYRIAQEALNNAIKYAGATVMELIFELDKTSGHLKMILSDNGKGFDTKQGFRGNGLENMKARASELGGAINIHSELAKGTRIMATIPL